MNNVMVPKLNSDKTVCTLGEVQLKQGQTIDYKSATDIKVSMGKIVEFKYAGWKQEDKTSVHARVVDTVDNTQSEWVSMLRWHEQYLRGIFSTKPKQKEDENREDSADNMPF